MFHTEAFHAVRPVEWPAFCLRRVQTGIVDSCLIWPCRATGDRLETTVRPADGELAHVPVPYPEKQNGFNARRGAGVVERGGLENRCTLAGTEGSNPSLSAISTKRTFIC